LYYNTLTAANASTYYDLNVAAATRAGEQFGTGSSLIGKKITQVVLVLKKTGTPTGTASVVIRKAVDDAIVATIGTIDVSTITTTDKEYTFTNTSNTYPLAAGDLLLIEYTGGSTSNFISLKRTDADAFEGSTSVGVSE
jgi:hypothetical protein